MKHRFTALFCTLILCLCLVSCAPTSPAQPIETPEAPTTEPSETAPSSPLLYKASDASGNEIYLFGSIHVGDESMYPLPSYVTEAFDQAEGLAVECDIVASENDMNAMAQSLQALVYIDGTTIKDHISEELYVASKTILEENESYNALLDYYMPIMWSSTIDSFVIAQYGYDAGLGIDRHLLTLAKENDKPIHEIESVDFQYNMFASFSEDIQYCLLASSVETYNDPDMEQEFEELVDCWVYGDEQGLVSHLESDTSSLSPEEAALYAEYEQAMIHDRNIAMADYAQEALTNDDELFICVGAAHIVGEGGMVDLLQERGYTVEPIKSAA